MTLRAITPFLAATATVAAQSATYLPSTNPESAPSHLRAAAFETIELPPEPDWVTFDDSIHNHAAFQYSAPSGSITLLLAHVMPDPATIEQSTTLPSMQALYPFLELPHGAWNANHETFGAQPWDYQNTETQQVLVPPYRVTAHVQALLAALAANQPQDFGPQSGSNPIVEQVFVRPTGTGWPNNPPYADERFTWSGTWGDDRVIDVGQVGCRGVHVAAYVFASNSDEQGVSDLDELIRGSYKWLLQVQAVHVVPPPASGGRPRVKFSQPVTLRRRSLGALQENQWLLHMGPERQCPSTVFANQWISLAGKGERLHVPFAAQHAHADLVACIQLESGQWVTRPRVLTVGGVDVFALRPTMAVFEFPAEGASGIAYFMRPDATPVPPLRPHMYSYGLGASVYAFVLPQPPL